MMETGPSVGVHQIRALEGKVGSTLPEDYAAFLLEINGGRTSRTHRVFDIHTNGARNTTSLNCLFSAADPDSQLDMVEWWELSRRWLPPELIPIGHDDGGGSILLGVAGEHRGEVWYLDGENPRPEGSNPRVLWFDRRDVCRLAASFTDFLAMLRPNEPSQ